MPPSKSQDLAVLELNAIARWDVCNRLRELSIPCHCANGQPLQVDVSTVNSAIQVWCVVQQLTASRETTVDRLERCWRKMLWK